MLVETHSGPCELVEDLTCCLDHSQYPLVLPVRGHIEVQQLVTRYFFNYSFFTFIFLHVHLCILLKFILVKDYVSNTSEITTAFNIA